MKDCVLDGFEDEDEVEDHASFSNKYGFVTEGGINYEQIYSYYLTRYPEYTTYMQRVSCLKMLIVLAYPMTLIGLPKIKSGVEYKRKYFIDEYGEDVDLGDTRMVRESHRIEEFRSMSYQTELELVLQTVLKELKKQGVISIDLVAGGRSLSVSDGGGGRPK